MISMLCLAGGAAMLYGQKSLAGPVRFGTPTVALLLGLMLLPGATFAARRLERRLQRSTMDRLTMPSAGRRV